MVELQPHDTSPRLNAERQSFSVASRHQSESAHGRQPGTPRYWLGSPSSATGSRSCNLGCAWVHGLHSQFRPDYQIPTADRLNEVFRTGGTISWAALASGSSTTPTPLLLDYHSASGSATEVLSLPTPGMLNTVNSSTAGAETRRKSTSDANFPPCPSPKCQRHGQSRVGGVASLGYSDRRPAPLASAAPGLLHSAIRCGPTPTLPVGPLLRGTDRGGPWGEGEKAPT